MEKQQPQQQLKASSSPSSSLSSSAAAAAAHDLWGLPPWLGQVGAILFFVTLFGSAQINADGYAMFRKCHGNCRNGLLHAVCMPWAVSGVFLVIRAVSDSATWTRQVQTVVTTIYLALYVPLEQSLQASPYAPWIFYITYLSILEGILYQHVYQRSDWTRYQFLLVGLTLIATNVGALEVVGHGGYEQGHHSYVSEFFNSVFHTPLYGIHSVLTWLQQQQEDAQGQPPFQFIDMEQHACW